MRNFKLQYSSFRETMKAPSFNIQAPEKHQAPTKKICLHRSAAWSLKFGTSLVFGVWCLGFPAALAQSFTINWFTVDGGGGTSTGGVYSVSGTIGQPDAGKLSGGNFTMDGGFWGIIAAVQSPGAPLLTITRTPTNSVMVSWPSPSTGFNLQQSPSLNNAVWAAAGETVNDSGGIKFIIVNSPAGNRFYRLVKP